MTKKQMEWILLFIIAIALNNSKSFGKDILVTVATYTLEFFLIVTLFIGYLKLKEE